MRTGKNEGTRKNVAQRADVYEEKRTGRNRGEDEIATSYSFSARRRVATRRACTTMPTTVGKSLLPPPPPTLDTPPLFSSLCVSAVTRRTPITLGTLGLSRLYGTGDFCIFVKRGAFGSFSSPPPPPPPQYCNTSALVI